MYFKARNGTYKRVPQVPNRSVGRLCSAVCLYLQFARDLFNDKYTGKTTGGFVVYYVSGGKGDVTAFKPVGRLVRRQHCTDC